MPSLIEIAYKMQVPFSVHMDKYSMYGLAVLNRISFSYSVPNHKAVNVEGSIQPVTVTKKQLDQLTLS